MFDTREAVREQAKSIGAEFLTVCRHPEGSGLVQVGSSRPMPPIAVPTSKDTHHARTPPP